jgi:hypothetical protein
MDYGIAELAGLFVSNDYKRSENGAYELDINNNKIFAPRPSARHLAGEGSYNQHGEHLFCCAEGDIDDDPRAAEAQQRKNPADGQPPKKPRQHKEGWQDDRKLTICPVCNKDSRSPNDFMSIV